MERWIKFALFFLLALVVISLVLKAIKIAFFVLVVLALLYFVGIIGQRKR